MKHLRFWLAAAALYLLAAIAPHNEAAASQSTYCLPTSGTLSGLTLVNNINSAFDAVLTQNSGASAPTPACGAVAKLGTPWLDTNTNTFKVFDGAQWTVFGSIDTVNHYWRPVVGGGTNTLASATTPDLCGTSTPSATVSITGTTTITGFGSNCVPGTWKTIVFAGALQLTHNGTSFILPNNGSNITTAAGDSALVVTIAAGQYRFASYIKADGTPLNSTNVTAQALTTSARSFDPINLGLTASVSSNLLTVTLTGNNGSTPAANNPVLIPFRSATATTGTPDWVSVTSATSISTFATGATLGSSNGIPFRFWIVALNNSGTVVLGLVNCSTGTFIASTINNEAALVSSVSMTGSATNAGVIYTPNGTTVTTKAFKILGYVEFSSGQTTAGTYATGPTALMLFGPGVKKPGDVVQMLHYVNGSGANAAVSYTPSATPPTTAQSVLAVSGGVTVSSVINPVSVQGQTMLISSAGSNQTYTAWIYDGTSALSIAMTGSGGSGVAFTNYTVPVRWQGLIGASASKTFSIYGACSSTTCYMNSNNAPTTFFGGAANTFLRIEEIMGANDNEAVGLPALPKVA